MALAKTRATPVVTRCPSIHRLGRTARRLWSQPSYSRLRGGRRDPVHRGRVACRARATCGQEREPMTSPLLGEFLGTMVLILLGDGVRSEEHTSELQSLTNLVCRLL